MQKNTATSGKQRLQFKSTNILERQKAASFWTSRRVKRYQELVSAPARSSLGHLSLQHLCIDFPLLLRSFALLAGLRWSSFARIQWVSRTYGCLLQQLLCFCIAGVGLRIDSACGPGPPRFPLASSTRRRSTSALAASPEARSALARRKSASTARHQHSGSVRPGAAPSRCQGSREGSRCRPPATKQDVWARA